MHIRRYLTTNHNRKTNKESMDISIKPLSAGFLVDYLLFFDNMVFTENPDWSGCYCFSFHFIGTNDQWNRNSIKTIVKNGKFSVELPIDTFLVMPSDVNLYSDENTVIIEEGIVLEKDFSFWKCTSY